MIVTETKGAHTTVRLVNVSFGTLVRLDQTNYTGTTVVRDTYAMIALNPSMDTPTRNKFMVVGLETGYAFLLHDLDDDGMRCTPTKGEVLVGEIDIDTTHECKRSDNGG